MQFRIRRTLSHQRKMRVSVNIPSHFLGEPLAIPSTKREHAGLSLHVFLFDSLGRGRHASKGVVGPPVGRRALFATVRQWA